MPDLNFSNNTDEINGSDGSELFAIPAIMLVTAIPVLLPEAKLALDDNHIECAKLLFKISGALIIGAVAILIFLLKAFKN
jgi:hypothetical protein